MWVDNALVRLWPVPIFITNNRCPAMLFFFFKQKTAYEMRISDWSSDLCSSDLIDWRRGHGRDALSRPPMECAARSYLAGDRGHFHGAQLFRSASPPAFGRSYRALLHRAAHRPLPRRFAAQGENRRWCDRGLDR